MKIRRVNKKPAVKMRPVIVWPDRVPEVSGENEFVQLHNAANNDELPKRFERKFYLMPQKVNLAYALLSHVCHKDSEFPSEQINSLYFDTSDLDQHKRSLDGDFRKDKIRIRWYGGEENKKDTRTIFIELKSRRGFSSTKQRIKMEVPEEALIASHLCRGIISPVLLSETLAKFGYISYELLQPVIKISYWRYRFRELITGQSVSLDTHVRSTMVACGMGNGECELEFPGGVIEIKGNSVELPPTLGNLKMLDLDWTRFSKYAACIDSHVDKPGVIGHLSPPGKIF